MGLITTFLLVWSGVVGKDGLFGLVGVAVCIALCLHRAVCVLHWRLTMVWLEGLLAVSLQCNLAFVP